MSSLRKRRVDEPVAQEQAQQLQKHSLQLRRGSTFEKIVHIHQKNRSDKKVGRKFALVTAIMLLTISASYIFYTTYLHHKTKTSAVNFLSIKEIVNEIGDALEGPF